MLTFIFHHEIFLLNLVVGCNLFALFGDQNQCGSNFQLVLKAKSKQDTSIEGYLIIPSINFMKTLAVETYADFRLDHSKIGICLWNKIASGIISSSRACVCSIK